MQTLRFRSTANHVAAAATTRFAIAFVIASALWASLSLCVPVSYAAEDEPQALQAASVAQEDGALSSQASKSAFAYKTAVKVNKAALSYITDMYIKTYPSMGTEIMFGSPKDNAILKKLSNNMVKGQKSVAAKCKAIAKWTKQNIAYVVNATVYPIDVVEKRKSDCLGYAYLMQTCMRMQNIPAVVCAGDEGDMKRTLKLSNIGSGEFDDGSLLVQHAWVLAYYKGAWHLYDPLFDVYGNKDAAYMNSWYFTKNIEGVTPYYKGIDLNLVTTGSGTGICRVNGTMRSFGNGKLCLPTDADIPFGTYYLDMDGIGFQTIAHQDNDGFEYVDEPDKIGAMKHGEVYADGWITYGGMTYYYARPNGILSSDTFKEHDGEMLYLSDYGEAFRLSKSADSLSMTDGLIQIEQGKSIGIEPLWINREDRIDEDVYACWYTENPETLDVVKNSKLGTVNQKGVFKAGKKATGFISVCCTEFDRKEDGKDYHNRTCWANSSLTVFVAASPKRVDIRSLNPMRVHAKTTTIKYAKLKKKSQIVKPLTVTKAKGAVSYKKTSGSKALSIEKSTGKVKMAKGAKTGTYQMKVKVTAAGNATYKARSKTLTVKVLVK